MNKAETNLCESCESLGYCKLDGMLDQYRMNDFLEVFVAIEPYIIDKAVELECPVIIKRKEATIPQKTLLKDSPQ